ncbi:MAG: DUF116 domain-containing protein [Limnochordia bacterium]|jgi:hypothetical protein|nr:DUF116 domain-containing protein [Limnochordia bacterium]MDD2629686.1 DUF116 domain-containing protein [Limnochordia bacterium]
MKPITYTLTPSDNALETYYQSAEGLAKEVLTKMQNYVKPIIDRRLDGISMKHTPVEQTCLELLLMGVYANRNLEAGEHPTIVHLEYVLDCLEHSSDYTYQSGRLREWYRFLAVQPRPLQESFWNLICEITLWFAQRALEVLGPYTQQGNHFLATHQPRDSNQYNALFRSSPILEYHINMVGAEILNRIWRDRFSSTKQRIIVLPGCLRLNPLHCQASEWTIGLRCAHCTDGCQVSYISKAGKQLGFQVSFVIHQSSLVSHVESLNALRQKGDLGILGVACALSLLEGGFLLDSHKIPAQCVPLDFCGCINHWHDQGITTTVNLDRLLKKVS